MILNREVMNWLKLMFPDVPKWGVSFINKEHEKVIGVYSRRNGRVQPQAVGMSSGYGIKSITILIHWGKGATPCEEQANMIYERLQECSTNEQIGGHNCWIEANQLPVMIGKDENGYFEAVLDFDIYYRKEIE